ncbi:hypothetical protein K431DRAFT_308348 [Polychaeton citri CBS 116435]|uniref:Uncharacterized protein n=1 Tax=Polychaeton citri CBS 116435 TaxID=1314669 RepID=A0A9P4PXF2_9PEZI|nr:hypothetical protein K431DRAFT_308348 [Polychaeton citri CBS 116435]
MCSYYVFMIAKYSVDYNKLEGERYNHCKHSNRPNCYIPHISFAGRARHVKRLYRKYKRACTRAGDAAACRANYMAPKNRVDGDDPPKSSDSKDYDSSDDSGATPRLRHDNQDVVMADRLGDGGLPTSSQPGASSA